MRHAKIVCTLGPATNTFEKIARLIDCGMDVARLNFSHGDWEGHKALFEFVRRAAQQAKRPIGILADLAGPKIRLGEIENGGVEIRIGDRITFTNREVLGTAACIGVNYSALPAEVQPGMKMFADDGRFEFLIRDVDRTEIHCDIVDGGLLKSRKGLNVPLAGQAIPALTEKDRRDLEFARELGVDYFALSFVRKPEDVLEAKALAGDIPVIAKIEKPSAIERLEDIADAADGMMVARGDMGIEVGFEKVPLIQKRIIKEMMARGKPVITATQMLESMVTNPQATRAEVSDVANAVLDGTDAVMLSAETAAGAFPFESVLTMGRIIEEVERSVTESGTYSLTATTPKAPSLDLAIAHAAARTAIDLRLKAIAVYTERGKGVALASSYRPRTSILALSPDVQIINRMPLLWGVVPLAIDATQSEDFLVRQLEREVIDKGIAKPGDVIAVALGQQGQAPAATSVMKLWRLSPL